MSFTWNSWGWLNLAIDLLVVLTGLVSVWIMTRRRGPAAELAGPRTIIAAPALALAAWTPAVFIIGGILGASLGARAAWTTVTVTAPLISFWLAKRTRAVWPIFLALSLLGMKYYGEVWEPNRLEIEKVEIRLPGLRGDVKAVLLADLQTDWFKSLQTRVRDAANAFDPDVVIFAGDMINHPRLAPEATAYLAGFKHHSGKYFVTGDVDGGYDLNAVLAGGGFELMNAKSKIVVVGPSRFELLGIAVADVWNTSLIHRLAAQESAFPKILISHRPDAIVGAEGVVDLVLSGHTHGGQVCLPFFGPVVTLTTVARSIAAGGLHRYGRLQILLTRGLGWEGHIAPRVRMFCRPHLLLVTLKPV